MFLILRYSRVKIVIFKNDEGTILVCKAGRICITGERRYKYRNIFVEEKKQNNFVLDLLAYVWGKIRDKLIWTQVVIKDL